ncbi:MerR family transcriptional regulator [uncultured Cohaesibacter sp.]|uniref:MerR family transcriptional regulator n=1 Tax=uncultured Cohaesibacter sp. TaxID=1002546 RepID=UPI0029C9048B|nr:MerR family transcriptional regulator [uncultured Cohaesibacter sp.]
MRTYEDKDLIAPVRSENGYRTYSGQAIHRPTFLKRPHSNDFSLEEYRPCQRLPW